MLTIYLAVKFYSIYELMRRLTKCNLISGAQMLLRALFYDESLSRFLFPCHANISGKSRAKTLSQEPIHSQATVSDVLAQGPYVAARVGFKLATVDARYRTYH